MLRVENSYESHLVLNAYKHQEMTIFIKRQKNSIINEATKCRKNDIDTFQHPI
jgi:hypothetical protein